MNNPDTALVPLHQRLAIMAAQLEGLVASGPCPQDRDELTGLAIALYSASTELRLLGATPPPIEHGRVVFGVSLTEASSAEFLRWGE
ncbi:MAG: hypothetical protein ACEQSH_00465 [Bacteroidia bacterium]